MEYKPTIGIEVHAELNTRTKMFCDSPNPADYAPEDIKPNTFICPVCMAHPGTLPVINKEAVKHVLTVGLAVGGGLADFTEFDRKNYFYPDLPKGYQISQYQYPLVSGGELAGVALTRIHLEEDTASSQHTGDGHALVDFNRAGVPLMELVTEPVVESAEQAGRFARELQLLLRTLDASNANMELGQMRVEANISVSASEERGTKVEVKNLNSFRAVERAIGYEIDRQISLLEHGESVIQETRGWSEEKQATFSQRAKEEAYDYRYFPDPDLPKLILSEVPEFSHDALAADMPELPWEKRRRLKETYAMGDDTVEAFLRNPAFARLLEEASQNVTTLEQKKTLVNYITSDIAGLINESPDVDWESTVTPEALAELAIMTDAGEISSRGAKDILAELFANGGSPRAIAEEKNLFQKSDAEELRTTVQSIIEENPDEASRFKNGEEKLLQFFVGQGMKATRGSANPEVLASLFKEELAA